MKEDVGVIVGRFQVDELHDGHIDLITQIIENHPKVIIFLGLSPCKCTSRNPLDFEARKKMILNKFPNVIVLYIVDQYSDITWSDNLDSQIKNIIGANQTALLYGSRDSFIKYYSGKFPCKEIEQTVFTSGTEIRKKISNQVSGTPEFRQGVIWAVNNQYPKCHSTVDAAIIKHSPFNDTRILLGKRSKEPKYRLIGGFVQPGETYEDAAVREVKEETGIDVFGLKYIKSFVIDDWRYRSEVDKITTALFVCNFRSGTPEPKDDIDELRWFTLNVNLLPNIVEEHVELVKVIMEDYL